MRKLFFLLGIFLLLNSVADAQWQVDNNAVPLGRGPGKVGFGKVTGSTGFGVRCLLDTTPPTFGFCNGVVPVSGIVCDNDSAKAAANQAAIEAAISTALSAPSGSLRVVQFPSGTCTHNAPINVVAPLILRGNGSGITVLRNTSSTADGVRFLYPGEMVGGGLIGMTLESGSGFISGNSFLAGSSGVALVAQNFNTNFVLRDFSLYNYGYGLVIAATAGSGGAWAAQIDGFDIRFIANRAIEINCGAAADSGGDRLFNHGQISNNGYQVPIISQTYDNGTGVVSVTTAAPHGQVAGGNTNVEGTTPSGYNNSSAAVVSVADSTHYTYQLSSGLGLASPAPTPGYISGARVGTGIYICKTGGDQFSSIDITSMGRAVTVAPVTGTQAAYTFFRGILGDTSADYGWVFDTSGGGNIIRFMIENSWAGFSDGDGVLITGANTDGLTWAGGSVAENKKTGFNLAGGKNILITGGAMIAANSRGNALTYPGIQIAADIGNITITNSRIGNFASGFSDQGDGINIAAGASDKIIIQNNNLWDFGVTKTGIVNGGTGTEMCIRNNLGSTVTVTTGTGC